MRRQRRRQRAAFPDPASLIIQPSVSAEVIHLDQDRYEIGWSGLAESVCVYAGDAPERIQRAEALASASHSDRIQVQTPLPRPYFEVQRDDQAPYIVAERILRLSGIANLRDIGGYQTRSGQQVR